MNQTLYRSHLMNLARLSAKRLKCHLLRLSNMRCRNLPKRSVQAPHTPFAAISCWCTFPRSNRRCHLHQGKSRRNRGPRHSGHWEGGLIGGTRNSHISDLGGTSFALYYARQDVKSGFIPLVSVGMQYELRRGRDLARLTAALNLRPRLNAYPLAANPANGSPVAPCVIISGQTAAVRDSQHRCTIVHVHRFHRVCQWLILILVNQ